MASNRFAALSPEYEEEQHMIKQKAQAEKAKLESLKAKPEEKPKSHLDKKFEGKGDERRPAERGRGRGAGRSYRGRGGPRRFGEEEGDYIAKDKPAGKEPKEYRYTGNNNPNHPFDRKSGTGRGTEVPKRGAGRANWGNPVDDWKNSQRNEQPESEQVPIEELKEGKIDKEDVKAPEPPKEPEVPVLTYSEYQAKMAEKQAGLVVKKPEVQVTRDPKTAAGLALYEKKIDVVKPEGPSKKKKGSKEVATEGEKELVLGTFIAEDKKPFRKYEKKPETQESEPIQEERGFPAGKRGRGGYKGPAKREEKKPESIPFVMNDEDFPAL